MKNQIVCDADRNVNSRLCRSAALEKMVARSSLLKKGGGQVFRSVARADQVPDLVRILRTTCPSKNPTSSMQTSGGTVVDRYWRREQTDAGRRSCPQRKLLSCLLNATFAFLSWEFDFRNVEAVVGRF
jgi:hypothetical protein